MTLRTMRAPRVNRRAFLFGAGGIAIGLPFLEGLQERSAWAAGSTPRFGLFICTANGVVQGQSGEPERFWPAQVGPLTPENLRAVADERCTGLLADHADRLLIVRGVHYPSAGTGCSHAQGLVQCLTGRAPGGPTNNYATSTGPSIDTLISDALNPTGVGPLTLYSGMKSGYINEKLSFSAAGRVRAAEGNPYNVYQRLVGLVPTEDDLAMAVALKRKSVNDFVRAELNDLRQRSDLSQADRERLDQHFDSIREIEVTMTDMARACTDGRLDVAAIEALRSGDAFRRDGQIEEVAKLHMELVALAFACNATRVATLQIGDGTDGTHYTIDGQRVERFHWISHRVESDGGSGTPIPQALEWHASIDRIRMSTFRHLLERWSTYSTESGPLLDHAFAMWTNQLATGPSHSFRNLPVVIAGRAGGALRQAQYVDAGGATNDRLLNALLQAAGADPATSGIGDGQVLDALLT